MMDWIPVSERLPDIGVMVLAWFAWPHVDHSYRHVEMAEISTGHWRPKGGNGNFDEYVTHWMPLPEPPK